MVYFKLKKNLKNTTQNGVKFIQQKKLLMNLFININEDFFKK